MRHDVIFLIMGYVCLAVALPLLVICGVSIALDELESALTAFLGPAIFSAIFGIICLKFVAGKESASRLRDKEAIVAVGLSWLFVVLVGAFPYWLGGMFYGPFVDGATTEQIIQGFFHSWFESMSGFTTSGSTVIDPLSSPACAVVVDDCINAQNKGLLLWRSFTQWLGGMGIIMLGMLILSRVLGGGMTLARAELTGPSLSRLRPQISKTARDLWLIYIGMTILLFVMLLLTPQMDWFDALNHSLTTAPTGGFSTRDASIAYYDSFAVESIIIFGMFVNGINYTLLWFLVFEKKFFPVYDDEEFRTYFIIIFVAFLCIFIALLSSGLGKAFRDSLFQVVALGTSSGFASADYMAWPAFTQFILLILFVFGACAGSTSGGLKILRGQVAVKYASRELLQLANPRKVIAVRMNKDVVAPEAIRMVVGMLIIWIGLVLVSSVFMSLIIPDETFESIFSLVVSSLGNVGPAMGDFGPTSTWARIPSSGLLLTSFLMWAGRLELLTVAIIFHPKTWRLDPGEQRVRLLSLFRGKNDEEEPKD